MNSVLPDIKGYIKSLDNIKIIVLYRYFSTIITSLFYLIMGNKNSILSKLIVILCVSISAQIFVYLYTRNLDNLKIIKVLVIIESLGITLFLIPTGGLNSPYIWYALNTILVAACLLPVQYCWINLSLYLILTIGISNRIFNQNEDIIGFTLTNSNLILIFILMTGVLLLLSKVNKIINDKSIKLTQLNDELKLLNERSNESRDYIMSLYQTIHSLSDHHCKQNSIKLLLECIKKITKSSIIIFYNFEQSDYIYEDSENSTKKIRNELESQIENNLNRITKSDSLVNIEIDSHNYMFILVKSSYKTYGILGVENNVYESDILYLENIKQLKFLSELSAIILDKIHLEEIYESMLIKEEQNRIANEMHDSVCQRLFAISCASHSLSVNYNHISASKLKETINDIKDSAQIATKELRTVIYRLSLDKQESKSFETDIKKYLDEISKLHNVSVNFQLNGNSELLNYDYKKAVYRIICEGTGNAIRHGKSKNINITLFIKRDIIKLSITDDGSGFIQNSNNRSKNNGLGLRNIKNLVYSLNGNLNINSKVGKGTVIDIAFIKENLVLIG